FLFTPTSPTAIYTLSLHDALPIFDHLRGFVAQVQVPNNDDDISYWLTQWNQRGNFAALFDDTRTEMIGLLSEAISVEGSLSETRSEEHTSELQSRFDLVCRLLLEK